MTIARTLAATVVTLGLFSCDMFKTVDETPPDVAMKKIVTECVKAANAKNVGAMIPYVADNFVGPNGLGKAQLQQVLSGEVMRNPDIAMFFIPKMEVKPTGKQSATVTATVVISRRKAAKLEDVPRGDIAAIYRVDANAERQGEEGWRFLNAKYDTAEGW
jgi:hypothetical protein